MHKKIMITQNYLLIPVSIGGVRQTVSFYQGEEKIYEFEVPVAVETAYTYDFQSPLPADKWIGKEIVMEGEVPAGFMEVITQTDQAPVSDCARPIIHFTPETGWMNDPCGLLYQNGTYHLYFQHNPFDVEWGNMSWGHAVSKDLLHWEQQEEAMWPDEEGTIFTGSALVNKQGLFGLPEDAQLYIYTSAGSSSKWSKGKKFVQKLAWSTDNGKTLNKREGCILDHIVGDNRDMNVYWHEGKQLYFTVMFWEKNDYAILNSTDLQNWKITQKVTWADAWECPDLMEVPVEGGGTKWLFWTADGYYFVGDFDGSVFTPESAYAGEWKRADIDGCAVCTGGKRREAYHSMLPYAAQSFNGTDRVIMIPWMRTYSKSKHFTGMMGIPRQLTLVEKDGAHVLRQKLVNEFEQAKEKMLEAALNGEGMEQKENSVTYEQKENAVVEVLLRPQAGSEATVNIYGTEIILSNNELKISEVAQRTPGVMDAIKLGDKEKLTSPDQNYRILPLCECTEKISLITDGEILEVTVNDGMMSDAFENVVDEKSGKVSVSAETAVNVEIYQIK